ncbi:MAG: hypothetical protein ABJA90_05475 [Ginsengibacter sp.]
MKYLFALLFLTATTSTVAFSQQKTQNKIIKGYKVITPKPVKASLINSSRPDLPQDLPVTYTFTGDGNWNDPANWENNLVPPQPTNLGSEIIINNIPSGQCLLNIPYTVTPGTSLTILTDKSLVVPSDFTVN